MSLSCQCLKDTYCQLGVILSAHFDGVQKIMSSMKTSAVSRKKEKVNLPERLPIKVQTRLLGLRRWSYHWICTCILYLVALLLIFIPCWFTSYRPNSGAGAWNIILTKKYYKPEQSSQVCPANAFFILCWNSRQHILFTWDLQMTVSKTEQPFWNSAVLDAIHIFR